MTEYLWDDLPEFVYDLLINKLIPHFPDWDPDWIPDTVDEFKDFFHNLINKNLPQLSDGKFGVFKGRNDTSENSFYRVNDGENDQCLYLSTIEFNGKTSLPQSWWPDVAPTPKGNELGIKGKILSSKGCFKYPSRYFLWDTEY